MQNNRSTALVLSAENLFNFALTHKTAIQNFHFDKLEYSPCLRLDTHNFQLVKINISYYYLMQCIRTEGDKFGSTRVFCVDVFLCCVKYTSAVELVHPLMGIAFLTFEYKHHTHR